MVYQCQKKYGRSDPIGMDTDMSIETTEPVARAGIPPSLSVILCVNRSNRWFSEAIQSVLDQDDRDFEFLIGANACTDELWTQLEHLAATDSRVRIFRSSIGQLAFNLNLLADHARGEYLVRMDADDISEPNRLRQLKQTLAAEQLDVLGSAVTLIDSEGTTVGRMNLPLSGHEIVKAMPVRTVFCHPAVALRRRFLLDMRGYLGGFVSEDADLWLRACRANARMRNLPEALLRYRVHDDQSIASRAGYAEMAAHWLRELLIRPCWFSTKGFVVALFKATLAPMLPGARRYRHADGGRTHEGA